MPKSFRPSPKWVYRISLFILMVVTLKSGQFTFNEYYKLGPGFFEAPGTDYQLLWAAMRDSFWLIGAVFAMAFRSGAVIWILSLYVIIHILPVFLVLFQIMSAIPACMTTIVMSLPIVAAGFVFRYLVKTGELRQP